MGMPKKTSQIKAEDLKPENLRITISMRLPGDLIDGYREQAEKLGIGYQTLMQMRLREGLQKDDLVARLEAVEKRLREAS